MSNRARKKVLFLVPCFTRGVGGAERVISTLLRHLDHTQFECHLAKIQQGTVFIDDNLQEVTIHELNVSRMRYALPSIVRLVWKVRPQTILSTVSYLNVMLMLAKPFLPSGTRLLLREATTPSAFIAQDTHYPRLWRWFYLHLYPRADKVICLSDAMQQDMINRFGLSRDQTVRIYNPVDFNALLQLAQSAPNPYQATGPHLVVAGRLRIEKGIDLLLQAMPAVVERFPHVRLAILGEGPQETTLKEQALKVGLADRVDFLGFQINPWPYFYRADVFVLPSRFEGMPNALLEALALGTPAVATNSVEAMREIHAANENMVLVPPDDPDALAEGINSLLLRPKLERDLPESPTRRMDKFDLQRAVSEYSRLF